MAQRNGISEEAIEHLSGYLAKEMEKAYAVVAEAEKDGAMRSFYRDRPTLKSFYGKSYAQQILWHVTAQAICDADSKYFLVNHKDGSLNVYNGRFYESNREKPEECLRQIILGAYAKLEIGYTFRTSLPKQVAYDVWGTLQSREKFAYKPNKRYIAFQNGVLDVYSYPRKECFKTHFDSNYRPYLVLDFEYYSKDEHYILCSDKYNSKNGNRDLNPYKLWDFTIGGWNDYDTKGLPAYKNAIFPMGDYRKAAQMFIGGLFVDREQIAFQYVCILQGKGANGKSLFTKAIANIFPTEKIGRFSLEQLFGKNNRFAAACTNGTLVNIAGDLDDKDFSGGAFKNFAEGAPMEAERKGVDFQQMIPPIILGCTNFDPVSRDKSWGHYRRIRLIQTRADSIPEEDCDTELESKLGSDDAKLALLHWSLEGYVKLKQCGYKIVETEDMKRTRGVLMLNDSSVRQFVHYNEIEPAPINEAERKTASDMYAWYSAWCSTAGVAGDDKERIYKFGKQMHELGFQRNKGLGGNIYWHYKFKTKQE